MAFEKELPQWKEKGVKPPQSKLDEGWKVQDKPPAAWLNWQMNKTYEALKEVHEKAAEKTDVTKTLKDAKDYMDQKVADIDLSKITPESIGAAKQEDLTAHVQDNTKHITAAERKAWNGKETPEGAQEKANAAELNAKKYVDAKQWQKTAVTDGAQAITYTRGDLNADLSTGWYMGSEMANAPTGEWYYIEVIKHNSAWRVQNAYCFNRDSYYQRMQRNGIWSAWSQDLFQSGVNAKQGTVDALNSKSVSASINENWPTLNEKIRQIPLGSVISGNWNGSVEPYGLKTFNLFSMPWNANYMTLSLQDNSEVDLGDNASPTNSDTRSRYSMYIRNDFGQRVAIAGWQNTEYSVPRIKFTSLWISKPDKGGWIIIVSADFQGTITMSKMYPNDPNFRWEGTLYFDMELHGGNHASWGKSSFNINVIGCTCS